MSLGRPAWGQFASFGRRHGRLRRALGARRALDPGRRGRGRRPRRRRRGGARRPAKSARGRSPTHGAELLAAAAAIRADGPAVERVHVDLERGSLVVVRDGERTIVATTVAEPTVGLVAYDLRTAARTRCGRTGREDRSRARARRPRRVARPAAADAGRAARRRRRGRTAPSSSSERARRSASGSSRSPRGAAVSAVDELGRRLLETALLEGDFTLRSGKRSRGTSTSTASRPTPGSSASSASGSAAAVVGRGARCRATRGAGARSGRTGRISGHGVRAALHHRAR